MQEPVFVVNLIDYYILVYVMPVILTVLAVSFIVSKVREFLERRKK